MLDIDFMPDIGGMLDIDFILDIRFTLEMGVNMRTHHDNASL